jgi:ribokinase
VTPAVIVVGSINVDLVTYTEHLPAPGGTVIGGTFSLGHGGKGANQAVGAARLGARSFLVGQVGKDDFGEAARAELESEGVILDGLRTSPGPTGVAQILVDARGENLISVASGVNKELTGDMVVESLRGIDADDAVVAAVLEVPDDAVAAAGRMAAERGWPFVLNPAPARPLDAEIVSLCDVLTPNEHEVAGLGWDSTAELLEAGAGAVVVTKGASGADLLRPGHPPHHQASFPVRAVDTTGAGDAFSAALACALAERQELAAAVELAAACGALATLRPGARGGMPTRPELDDFLARGRGAAD